MTRRPPVPATPAAVEVLPTLDLSGPALRAGLQALRDAAARAGGLETVLDALRLKVRLFGELAGGGRIAGLEEGPLLALCTLMATVRRHVASWLAVNGFASLHGHLVALLDGGGDLQDRFDAFLARVPGGTRERWLRDLAAELLHFTDPERVPLMTRWMWDATAGSGVLREIWFEDAAAAMPPSDRVGTFRTLRRELDGFLREAGMYRDLALLQDLLCAQIYARYINDRGGAYLKRDFTGEEDPLAHTRRLLGLDCWSENGLRIKLKPPAAVAAVTAAPG